VYCRNMALVRIAYDMAPAAEPVIVTIYDGRGKLVERLPVTEPRGFVIWHTGRVTPGVYCIVATDGIARQSGRILVNR
jgi:hypothetical protein